MYIAHKETFYQPPHSGIPGYWVVQYYDDTSRFPQAQYFSREGAARELEREILRSLSHDSD